MTEAHAADAADRTAQAEGWATLRVAAATLLGVSSALVVKLALPAAFLVLITFLSLQRARSLRKTRILKSLLAVAAVFAGVGCLRFVVSEAIPGIVQGGKDAAGKNAVSRLREIVFAEDNMRKLGHCDVDADKVGSAGFIAELSGATSLRGGRPMHPILDQRYGTLVSTRIGPAARVGGYLYIVCMPVIGGGFSAWPGVRVDEERAERHFLAYAWPAAPSQRIEEAFFTDQHERILVSKNRDGKDPRYVGADFPPSCDAAEKSPREWRAWLGKKPRATLPGER